MLNAISYWHGIDLLTVAHNARTSMDVINHHDASRFSGEKNIALLQVHIGTKSISPGCQKYLKLLMTPASPALLSFITWMPYVLFGLCVGLSMFILRLLRRDKALTLFELVKRYLLGGVIYFSLFSTMLLLEDKLMPMMLGLPYEVVFPCIDYTTHSPQTLAQIFTFWSVSDMTQLKCH